jgi:hypothetical protein
MVPNTHELLADLVRRADFGSDHADERLEELDSANLEVEAMAAALRAYDEAFAAPSLKGLPSQAAIAAYRKFLPEDEGAIREKLLAALRRRWRRSKFN